MFFVSKLLTWLTLAMIKVIIVFTFIYLAFQICRNNIVIGVLLCHLRSLVALWSLFVFSAVKKKVHASKYECDQYMISNLPYKCFIQLSVFDLKDKHYIIQWLTLDDACHTIKSQNPFTAFLPTCIIPVLGNSVLYLHPTFYYSFLLIPLYILSLNPTSAFIPK